MRDNEPADIFSDRLDLRWMSPRFIEASLDGRLEDAGKALGASLPAWWPDDEPRRRLLMRLAQMREDPPSAEWLLRGMVSRSDKRLVGVINFHGRRTAAIAPSSVTRSSRSIAVRATPPKRPSP